MAFRLAVILGLAGLVTQPINAADRSDVHSFLSRLIDYETSGHADLRSQAFLSLLTPRFREAIQADMSGPEVGVLDYDPLCQCQDDDGLKMRVISVKANSLSAYADVENVFSGTDRLKVRFRLENGPHGWRLADVATSNQPSLLKALDRERRKVGQR
jgi:hypothetical protein